MVPQISEVEIAGDNPTEIVDKINQYVLDTTGVIKRH